MQYDELHDGLDSQQPNDDFLRSHYGWTELEVADLFSEYDSVQRVGRGGMGVVYRVRRRCDNTWLALKLLDADHPADATVRARLLREAKLHENVTCSALRLECYGERGGRCFLVRSWVDGQNLRSLMSGGPLKPSEALGVVAQIARQLADVHAHDWTHRDIKPENVIVNQGTATLIDFGIAKFNGQDDGGGAPLTAEGDNPGTLQYMAPEQRSGAGIDHRVDIYSLGVVLYEALTGQMPEGNFERPSEFHATIDRTVDELVLNMLQRNPHKRPQTADQLVLEIQRAQRAQEIFSRQLTPGGLCRRRLSRRESDQERELRRQWTSSLHRTNRELGFTDDGFTPLAAEVEVSRAGQSTRCVADLSAALRSGRPNQVLLVIGDPGSGKSVALRHFTIQNLESGGAKIAKRIPIYVDLKPWKPVIPWSRENPPKVDELKRFIRESVAESVAESDADSADSSTTQFVRRNFDRLLSQDRLFFLLDSFDEIPAVLDATEGSWTLQAISGVVWDFLSNGNACRGVVASRPFRRPQFDQVDRRLVTLTIKDFDDYRIFQTLTRSPRVSTELVKQMFSERPDLAGAARNPLIASLLREHLEHQRHLPLHLAELFERAIERRLRPCDDLLRDYQWSKQGVISAAKEIAWFMSSPEGAGLRVPLDDLEQALPDVPVRQAAEVLRAARLVRTGQSASEEFSFVHRRFQEYFVAKRIQDSPRSVRFDSIGDDAALRDALVLYAQVAEESDARILAEFCWSGVDDGADAATGTPEYLRSLHYVRFLNDAFGSRRECTSAFERELVEYVAARLEGRNLLTAKHAVEATGLLSASDAAPIIRTALEHPSSWIRETALRACRRLPRLDAPTTFLLKELVATMPVQDVVTRRGRDLRFFLSLSPAFHEVRRFLKRRVVLEWLQVISAAVACLVMPLSLVTGFLVTIVTLLLPQFLPFKHDRDRTAAFHKWFWPTWYLFTYLILVSMSIRVDHGTISASPEIRIGEWVWWSSDDAVKLHSEATRTGGNWENMKALSPFFATPPSSPRLFEGTILLAIGFVVVCRITQFVLYLTPFRDATSIVRDNIRRKVESLGREMMPRQPVAVVAVVALIATLVFVVALAIGVGPVLVGYWILSYLPEEYHWIGYSILATWSTVVVVFGVREYLPTFRRFAHDRKLLRSTRPSGDRGEVESVLDDCQTPWGRERYLASLQEADVELEGAWRSGNLPNYSNDEASTRLAQLEERSLGLSITPRPVPRSTTAG